MCHEVAWSELLKKVTHKKGSQGVGAWIPMNKRSLAFGMERPCCYFFAYILLKCPYNTVVFDTKGDG